MTALRSKEDDDLSLFEKSVIDLQNQLIRTQTPIRIIRPEGDRTPDRLGLAQFVEGTSQLNLDPWQLHLCQRLEQLTWQRGQRILLHKPPQHGGSVIVSQRFPAYLIGDDPACRVRLACYNIDHAARFGAINKQIVQSPEYGVFFPGEDLHVPSRSSDEEWFTRARKRLMDAQASFKALGLRTGFVGQGADHLIVDDPYASPQDANSEAIRNSTWLFWDASAKVRISEDTNVVVMFHRYREDDFAGQMIKEEGLKCDGGKWELISYRALWDGDDDPKFGGPDPMSREVGERLSNRFPKSFYISQQNSPDVFMSQFQGKPTKKEGGFFKIDRFKFVPKPPVELIRICRAWDLASTEDGDWTVGVKMALGSDERIYLLDVVRFREETNERNKIIKATTKSDWVMHRNNPDAYLISLPQDPNSAGKDLTVFFTQFLRGYTIHFRRPSEDKSQRADPFSAYVNAGLVVIILDENGKEPEWWPEYKKELQYFLKQKTDDQVDASSDAFSECALEIDLPPGESFDTMGLVTDFWKEINDLIEGNQEDELDLLIEAAQEVDLGEDSPYKGVLINGKVFYEKVESSPKATELDPNTGKHKPARPLAPTLRERRVRYKRASRNRSSRAL